ncbi:MAG: DNA polymerase III subunit gamma/tau [Deltaproteobacteria bacterium]|nr:DNA polymerase III subunit gamma/tau [Deltaproteobacteria bacterium]
MRLGLSQGNNGEKDHNYIERLAFQVYQLEYLVLARKWRPQSFEDVVGQDHVVRTLRNAIHQGRVAHAFIFSGPRGVGKTSVARIMAKAMNCETGPTQTSCNVCTSCREITGGIAMDVREIDGASHRGIDEIRNLRENIKFAPVSSRYKLYIIDEVHMLTREAFNALLKTLEEPPSHVIFIFATTEIHKIPATILSRCQCFDFRRIPLTIIRDSLRQIAEKEGIRISSTGITWIAQAGDGSLRDAQSVFDQVISYAGFEVDESSIQELLGLMDRHFLYRVSGAVLERNAGLCLKIIEEGYYAGLDMNYFYQMLLGHFRNLLLTKIIEKDHDLLNLGKKEEAEMMRRQTENVSRETLQRLLDILMTEEENVRKSQNPRIVMESILVRMAYLEPMVPIDTILSRMEGLEKRLTSGRGEQISRERYEVREKETVTSQELFDLSHAGKIEESIKGYESSSAEHSGDTWEDYKAYVKNRSYPLWSKIETGKLLGYENNCLRIGFHKDRIFLLDDTDKSRLTEISREFFKEEASVTIELLESARENGQHQNSTGSSHNSRNNDVRQDALKHPLLQKVLDVFEGAVVREVVTRRNQD